MAKQLKDILTQQQLKTIEQSEVQIPDSGYQSLFFTTTGLGLFSIDSNGNIIDYTKLLSPAQISLVNTNEITIGLENNDWFICSINLSLRGASNVLRYPSASLGQVLNPDVSVDMDVIVDVHVVGNYAAECTEQLVLGLFNDAVSDTTPIAIGRATFCESPGTLSLTTVTNLPKNANLVVKIMDAANAARVTFHLEHIDFIVRRWA